MNLSQSLNKSPATKYKSYALDPKVVYDGYTVSVKRQHQSKMAIEEGPQEGGGKNREDGKVR